jgi:L-lactate utilization protein LutB
MAAFASLEGFVITRVLVDKYFEHTTAFAELLAAVDKGEASHVLVPALHHFGHSEGVQLAMKDLLESKNGTRVLELFPAQGTGAMP